MSISEFGTQLPAWRDMNGGVGDKRPGLKWSADFPPPEVGTIVNLYINTCGPLLVEGYFGQDGYLGVVGHLKEPPGWFLKQNGGNVPAYAFGAEIKLIGEAS